MGADRKTTPGTLGNDTRTLLQTPEDLLTPRWSQSGTYSQRPPYLQNQWPFSSGLSGSR